MLKHYELILCDNAATCRRLSIHQHEICTADGMGHIHWSGVDRQTTRRGMRRLLKAIASVELKHDTRRIPAWQKLYEANVWAWEEGLHTWHIQFTQEMSKADRLRAYRLGGSQARTTNFPAYQWMRGRNKRWLVSPLSTGSSS